MNEALRLSDPLLPPPPGGLGRGALLALTAHAGLVAALTLGVQWHTQPVPMVAAEIWTALPQSAAPAPAPARETVEPPAPPAPPVTPTPRAAEPEADIAVERRRQAREREERLQAERERQQKARAQAEAEQRERAENERRERQEQARKAERERKLAEARLAQQREENLKRMMGQAAGTGSGGSGTARQDGAPSLAYGSRLIAHIKPNIVFTESLAGNPTAEVEVRAGPSGTIIARRLVKSSGSKEWDDAVLRAIDRTGALPRDSDGRVPPLLIIGFRPND